MPAGLLQLPQRSGNTAQPCLVEIAGKTPNTVFQCWVKLSHRIHILWCPSVNYFKFPRRMCVFSIFCFSRVFLKDILIPPPLSMLLSFLAPLPLWLINPLSIIWSQSITPFYRLSGGITISLSGAPLRMADPYQTEAMPWTKEPLWSSLHSATNVSISIGCSCPLLLLHDCLNRAEISLSSRQRKSLMNADDTVQGGGCGWQGCGGVQGYLDTDPDWEEVQAGCSFLKHPLKNGQIWVFVLGWF